MNGLARYQRYHLVGIGGSGMSALATLLLQRGFSVSGSDRLETPILARLRNQGAVVHIGHQAAHIQGAEALIHSSAIPASNPELQAAARLNLPLLHRSEAVAALMENRVGITVAGTHGKSTTAAMISHLLLGAGLDPTVALGAELPSIGGNAHSGQGEFFVLEADESDRTFLAYRPRFAVVTNLDNDHLEAYGSFERLRQAFAEHLGRLPTDGVVIACVDDPAVAGLIRNVHHRVITYGCESEADLKADQVEFSDWAVRYLLRSSGKSRGEIFLRAPGWHNVQNSLAAAALASALGISTAVLRESLASYPGILRRLEVKGEVRGVRVVDDYGHHPTEIRAALQACQATGRRLLVVFQPHRYSRTARLMDEWAAAFDAADELFLMDVYAAGEAALPGVSTARLAEQVTARRPARYRKSPRGLVQELVAESREGDLLLTLGAGDVWKIGELFLETSSEQ